MEAMFLVLKLIKFIDLSSQTGWLIPQKWFCLSNTVKVNLISFQKNKLSALQTLDLSPVKHSFISHQSLPASESKNSWNLVETWLAATLPTSHLIPLLTTILVIQSLVRLSVSFNVWLVTIYRNYSRFMLSPFIQKETFFSSVEHKYKKKCTSQALSTKTCFLRLFILQKAKDWLTITPF